MECSLKKIIFSILFAISTTCFAHQGLELGAAGGMSKPFAGEAFKSEADQGDAANYWVGYNLNDQWMVSLDYNSFDFDRVNVSAEMISLAGKYRWNHANFYHPFVNLGLGAVSSKNFSSDKHSGLGAHAGVGVEFDFNWITLGGLFRWNYSDKSIGALTTSEKYKDSQALLPMLTVSFHWPFQHEVEKVETKSVQQPVVVTPAPKDSDNDGVADENDLCSNTAAGVKVNQFGCAEKEKASIKLQIIFVAGKSIVEPKFQTEIDQLSAFMKKFPDAKVEIAGYTDNKGSAAKNTKLSADRAEAVAKSLEATGIEKSRISAKGYGPTQPIASNDTAEGRAQNRRVVAEISVETEVKK